MSSYYTRYCAEHGDWDQDIDRPAEECPECTKAGTAPSQLITKRIRELEATLRAVGELPGKWRINAGYFSINECADELEALLKGAE
jgi:hypothetical protein